MSDNFIGCVFNETDNVAIGCFSSITGTGSMVFYSETINASGNQNNALISGKSYSFVVIPVVSGTFYGQRKLNSSDLQQIEIFDLGLGSGVISSDSTRIDSVVPVSGSTVSTSTSFVLSASGFIKSTDFSSNNLLRFKFVRQQDLQQSVSSPELLYTSIDVPISASGVFEISTTTNLIRSGEYRLITQIRQDTFLSSALGFFSMGVLGDLGLLISTTTTFIASSRTALDIFTASTTKAINDFMSSSTISSSSCTTWSGFSLVDCLSFMLVWQPSLMDAPIEQIRTGFLTYAPFGYVTRFGEILFGSATSTLPTISVNMPAGLGMAGENFHFNPWQWFFVDGAPVKDEIVSNDSDQKNVWEIFNSFITIIVYLSLLLTIIKDLTGVHRAHKQNL